MEIRNNNNNNNLYGNYNGYNNFGPVYHLIKVNGRPSIETMRIGPNSDALFLDESGTLAWYVETDGVGYKKVIAPYDLTPHVDTPPVDLNDLLTRVQNLEETINARSNKGSSSKNSRNSNTNTTE